MEQKYRALLQYAAHQNPEQQAGMQLCFQVLSLARLIDQQCAHTLSAYGVSEGRFVVLFLLHAAKPASLAPHQLAQQAGVSRATMSGLLDGLQGQGLIERQADSQDKRTCQVVLTSSGAQLAQTLVERHSRWIAELFAGLSAQEGLGLIGLLKRASSLLEAPAVELENNHA